MVNGPFACDLPFIALPSLRSQSIQRTEVNSTGTLEPQPVSWKLMADSASAAASTRSGISRFDATPSPTKAKQRTTVVDPPRRGNEIPGRDPQRVRGIMRTATTKPSRSYLRYQPNHSVLTYVDPQKLPPFQLAPHARGGAGEVDYHTSCANRITRERRRSRSCLKS